MINWISAETPPDDSREVLVAWEKVAHGVKQVSCGVFSWGIWSVLDEYEIHEMDNPLFSKAIAWAELPKFPEHMREENNG